MNKIELLTELLDDQYWFVEECERQDVKPNVAKSVYIGMIRAIETLGYDWKRDFEGHHEVFGGAK